MALRDQRQSLEEWYSSCGIFVVPYLKISRDTRIKAGRSVWTEHPLRKLRPEAWSNWLKALRSKGSEFVNDI